MQTGHIGSDHTGQGQQRSSSQEDQAEIPHIGPEAEDQEANGCQPSNDVTHRGVVRGWSVLPFQVSDFGVWSVLQLPCLLYHLCQELRSTIWPAQPLPNTVCQLL